MLQIRHAADRGHFNHGWLDTYHTFSFGEYRDYNQLGFRKLRVINEDRVLPGEGFGTHPHRDMEIITYIISGELTHEDNMGHKSVIRPGDVQRMTAGSGIMHSEYNNSKTEIVHLLQIWIFPDQLDLTPEYDQKTFSESDKKDRLHVIVSSDGRDGSLKIHQDVSAYDSTVFPGNSLTYDLDENRHAWIQVIDGTLDINGEALRSGDGLAVSDVSLLTITGREKSDFLLFDLP